MSERATMRSQERDPLFSLSLSRFCQPLPVGRTIPSHCEERGYAIGNRKVLIVERLERRDANE